VNTTGAKLTRQRNLLKPVLYDLKCLTEDLAALQSDIELKLGHKIERLGDLHWHVNSIIKLIQSVTDAA
jgi:hypothetical protein